MGERVAGTNNAQPAHELHDLLVFGGVLNGLHLGRISKTSALIDKCRRFILYSVILRLSSFIAGLKRVCLPAR